MSTHSSVIPRLFALTALATMGGQACGQWSAPFGASGPSDSVNALAVASPSSGAAARLYVGGQFLGLTTPGGTVSSPYLASWNGQSWSPTTGMSGQVYTLAVHPFGGNPTLFVGKVLDSFGHGPLARLTNGQWVELTAGTQGYVLGLGSYDLGLGPRLALSSPFFQPSAYIAAWNSGSLEPIGSGLITVTNAFAVFDDGQGPRLYAGAGANVLPGLTYFARFDGTEWSQPAGGPFSVVSALAVYDDGTGPALYVGGSFTFLSTGQPCAHITRYKNGVFAPVGAGVNGNIESMAVFDDGGGPGLIVAGNFTTAGGQPAARIARWRSGQWSALGSGIGNGAVSALAVFDDDGSGPLRPALYAAGSFTSAGGFPAQRIARWGETSPCYANCDGSATEPRLNALDFQCFLSRFAAGDSYANCDSSSVGPVLNASDFACFLNAFAAGCL